MFSSRKFSAVLFLLFLIHSGMSYSFVIKSFHIRPVASDVVELLIEADPLFGKNIQNGFLILKSQDRIFQKLKMKHDQLSGFRVQLSETEINKADQFYFEFTDMAGNPVFYPDIRMGELPFDSGSLLPDDDQGIEIISPEPNSQVLASEVSIVISYLSLKDQISPNKTQIFIDKLDATSYAEKYEDFLILTPPGIKSGWHVIRIVLYDANNRLVSTRKFRFEVVSEGVASGMAARSKPYSGRFFINNRYESYQNNSFNKDFFYTGFKASGKKKILNWGVNFLISNQESRNKQPVNQYGVSLKIRTSNDSYVGLQLGDAFPFMDDLFFMGVRNRGIWADARFKFFSVQLIKGYTQRDIEGTADVNGNILTPGVYKRNVTGIIPAIHITTHSTTKFYYLHFKDDVASIENGYNPVENAVLGVVQRFMLDQGRINAVFQLGGSVFNRNIESGNISFDTLKNRIQDLSDSDKKYYDLAKKFITVNENLIFSIPYAMKGQLYLNYFQNQIMFQYQYIMESFQSLGNPYLLRDIKGITIRDNIQLSQGKVFLTLNYENLKTNFQDKTQSPTDIQRFGGTITVYPGPTYPSFSIGINSLSRNNHTEFDPNSYLFAENNNNTSLTFSTNYNFFTGRIKNLVDLSFVNYLKDDKISELGNTSGQTFSGLIRTLWNERFYSQATLIVNNNELAKNDPQFGSTMENSTFGFLLSYNPASFFMSGHHELKLNLSINTNKYSVQSTSQTIQKFITGLTWYMDLKMKGRFYLSSQLINYSKDLSGKDLNIFTGYELTF
jgi:hypothetical protein